MSNKDIDKPKRGGSFKSIATRQGVMLGSGNLSSLASVASTKRLEGAIILSLTDLVPNFFQVRQHFDQEALDELAEDIKERGILEPLLVRETEEGTFEIIAGERRYRAAQAAGLTEVPVIVRQMNDKEAQFATLAENLQRQDLDPKDEQRYFQQLQGEYNLSYAEIAKLINKSKGYVQNRLEGRIQKLQTNENNRSSQLQLSEISQSSQAPKTNKPTPSSFKYNPAVYRRVSQFFDNTIQILENNPDKQMIEQIRESVADTEKKLAELKKKLSEAAQED